MKQVSVCVCVCRGTTKKNRGQGFETINIIIILCFFWPSWMLEKLFAFFLIQLGRERQVEEKQKNRELF